MRKTTVLTATAVLVLTAGGSTAYAFAAGADDPARQEHARAAQPRAVAAFVRVGGHVLPVSAGDDRRRPHREAGEDHARHHARHHEVAHHARHRHVEAGDDRGTHVEAGDDHGGRGTHVEPGDDHGGRGTHVEPGDDHGGRAEAGDDHGGRHGGHGSDD